MSNRASARRRPRSGVARHSPRTRRSRRPSNHRRRHGVRPLPRGTASRSSTTQRRILGPAFVAATLLGAATAMLLASVAATMQQQSGVAGGSVVSAGLLAMALGVRVPQRFAVWACRLTLGSGRRSAAAPFQATQTELVAGGTLLPSHAAERSLYWLVLAVLALACGALVAATPLAVRWVMAARHALLDGFLWSAFPLSVLDHVAALVVLLLPAGALGMAVSCAHHLCCPRAEWDERASAWGLLGAAGGLLLAHTLVASVAASAGIIAAALPVLLVSLLSATFGSADARSPIITERERPAAPVWADRWPTLLRSTIVAVAAGGAFAAAMWCRQPGASTAALPSVLVGLGLGLALGHRRDAAERYSVGGFGTACAAAGLMLALAALTAGFTNTLITPSGCLQATAIGYAVSYGQQALLSRVGSRSAAGAYELWAMMACAAASVAFTAPIIAIVFAPTAALLMLALILVTTGGTLALHEAQDAAARRRARTGVAFASLMIMLLAGARPGGLLGRTVRLTAVAGATGR